MTWIIALIGLLFCLFAGLGILAVTIQAGMIVCGVLFLLVILVGFIPATAYPWSRGLP